MHPNLNSEKLGREKNFALLGWTLLNVEASKLGSCRDKAAKNLQLLDIA